MSEIEVIRTYYQRIVSEDFPYAREIGEDELRVKAVALRGCHGNSKNVLFLSCTTPGGTIADVKYECQYCDVTMYVTAELVCEWISGRTVDALADVDEEAMARQLGGKCRKVLRQARTALRLLVEGLHNGTGDTER